MGLDGRVLMARRVEVTNVRGEITDVPPDAEPVVELELEDNERVAFVDFTLWPSKGEARTFHYRAVIEREVTFS